MSHVFVWYAADLTYAQYGSCDRHACVGLALNCP